MAPSSPQSSEKNACLSSACSDGKTFKFMQCTLHMCCSVSTGWKQLEKQQLLFTWWLISNHIGGRSECNISFIHPPWSTQRVCSFSIPSSKSLTLHPRRALSSITALFSAFNPLLPLAGFLLPISFAFPHFHQCLLSPFSLLLSRLWFCERGLYQQVWMVQVHW